MSVPAPVDKAEETEQAHRPEIECEVEQANHRLHIALKKRKMAQVELANAKKGLADAKEEELKAQRHLKDAIHRQSYKNITLASKEIHEPKHVKHDKEWDPHTDATIPQLE